MGHVTSGCVRVPKLKWMNVWYKATFRLWCVFCRCDKVLVDVLNISLDWLYSNDFYSDLISLISPGVRGQTCFYGLTRPQGHTRTTHLLTCFQPSELCWSLILHHSGGTNCRKIRTPHRKRGKTAATPSVDKWSKHAGFIRSAAGRRRWKCP